MNLGPEVYIALIAAVLLISVLKIGDYFEKRNAVDGDAHLENGAKTQ